MNASAFSAWDIHARSQETFRRKSQVGALPGEEQVRHLLAFSLLAPSAHNTVPQRYGIDIRAGRIELFLDAQHVLEVSDPTGFQALLSVGCAIENLLIAAAHYGLRAEWVPDSNLCFEALQARTPRNLIKLGAVSLRFECLAGNPSPLLQAICDRRVIRSEYDKSVPLAPKLIAELQKAMQHISPHVKLKLFSDPKQRFSWAKLDEMAMKSKLEDAAFRRELGRSLIEDDDRETRRGMRGKEFGLDPPVASRLGAQLRGEQTLATDQTAFMARAGRVAMASSSAIAVIEKSDNNATTLLQAGRAYQRCALMAWHAGFAHSVHAGSVQVPHVRAICRATLLDGGDPAVVFRLGQPLNRVHWQRPHASRPQLEEVTICLEVLNRSHSNAA